MVIEIPMGEWTQRTKRGIVKQVMKNPSLRKLLADIGEREEIITVLDIDEKSRSVIYTFFDPRCEQTDLCLPIGLAERSF